MTTTTTSTRRKKMMTIEDDDDDDIDIPILVSSLRLNQLELEQEDDETILSLICSRPTSFNKITIPDELSYTKDNEKSIYAATQSGHTGAILSLQLLIRSSSTTSTSTSTTELIQQNSNWLTSSSTDGTIRVWNLFTSEPLYLIHCPRDNIGDILSLLWVPTSTKGNGRLYAGCQDTSIMWIDLPPPPFYSTHSLPSPSQTLPQSKTSSLTASNPSLLPSSESHSIKQPPLSHYPSLPTIVKPHNKFFDTLTPSERPRPISRPISLSGTPPTSYITGSISPTMIGSGGTNYLTLAQLSLNNSKAPIIRGFRDQRGIDIVESVGEYSQTVEEERVIELQIRPQDVKRNAHVGYVYSLALATSNDQRVIVSGSGDELIKLWTFQAENRITHLATLDAESDAVLALAVKDEGATVIAGYQGGIIKIWDLDSLSCIKSLTPHSFDILTLSIINDDFFSGGANGSIQRWDRSFNQVANWVADNIVLATCSSSDGNQDSNGADQLITGGRDAVIKIWDISKRENEPLPGKRGGFQGELFHMLSKFVSFKTIADDENREECRQGALFLKNIFKQFGASTVLLPGALNKNPIVVATFSANRPLAPFQKRKRVLFYGHYDVIPAKDRERWSMNPFEMIGRDGWVLGRGVSDNKGPILATAAAASDLLNSNQLDVDLVMIIEGEEETGSAGFQEAIKSHSSIIGEIDVILVSNSYWIGESVPCLTYGLRGVIHATLAISSDQPDMHSGMQGGTVHEPLIDMVRLLATLTDRESKILIPGFYDRVSAMGEQEMILLDEVVRREGDASMGGKLSHLADPRQSLISRWRDPALSMHNVSVVTGPASKTLISSSVTSTISVRIVPDQELSVIRDQIKNFLELHFDSFGTTNRLSVEIKHVADWWLGDLSSKYLKAFAECIESEWNIKPLYIREGGSIPSLPFLERQFNTSAVHFPMGTSSDSAHLPDERIRIINLEKGKCIISKWLGIIPNL